ncbi:MAG: hypothetical protein GTN80_11080 [Nitrososphaeria archaeon]|nr:hypothetical protein [Nitrososphaeria archaeon]NIQ34160.1 hypothetical protein [Nitrososphaeria archaeon]
MSDADAVKNYAKSGGAHLVGVASSDRLKGAPKGHRPEDLLSGAESVVVMALRIPLSIV